MADYSTRPAVRLGTALVVFLALVAVPLRPTLAAPGPGLDQASRWAADGPNRFLYWAQGTVSPELADAMQLIDSGGRFIFNLPWADMSGDRLDDVVSIDIDFGPDGLGLAGMSSKLTAMDGRTGSVLWSRAFEKQAAFPVEVTLGRKARTGVLALVYDAETYGTAFLALNHRGRRFYEHAFTPSTETDGNAVTGRDEVVSFDLQNSLRGSASDVLLGIANVTRGPRVDPAVPSLVARTRTAVIDGKTGDLVTHPGAEVGIGRVPLPLAAPDLDGDGLEDHLMTYVLPDVEEDEESGLPVAPAAEEELVRGRRGVDGIRLWTSPPLDLADGWDAPPLSADATIGDQTRDDHAEILLRLDQRGYVNADYEYVYPSPGRKGVWSLSGRNGDVLWHRAVTSARAIEDLDGDRRRDVVLVDSINGKKRSGTSVTGASGLDARRIYSRFFRVRRDDDQTVESSLWTAGDLQPDRVGDFVLDQSLRRERERGLEIEWVGETLLSGATGKRLGSLRDVSPLGASVDGRGDDLYRWRGSPSGMSIVDGRTRGPRLGLAFDIPLTLPTDTDYLIPVPARLDRDRCADFVGTLANSRSTFAVAIDGGSGRLLWARRQQGIDVGGPVKQTRRADRNGAC